MELKKERWSSCKTCGTRKALISETVYGCDECKRPIASPHKLNARGNHDFLQLTIFRDPGNSSAEHLQFCSWKCVLKFLPKVACNYFVSLPYLHYDEEAKEGQTARDFLRFVDARRK